MFSALFLPQNPRLRRGLRASKPSGSPRRTVAVACEEGDATSPWRVRRRIVPRETAGPRRGHSGRKRPRQSFLLSSWLGQSFRPMHRSPERFQQHRRAAFRRWRGFRFRSPHPEPTHWVSASPSRGSFREKPFLDQETQTRPASHSARPSERLSPSYSAHLRRPRQSSWQTPRTNIRKWTYVLFRGYDRWERKGRTGVFRLFVSEQTESVCSDIAAGGIYEGKNTGSPRATDAPAAAQGADVACPRKEIRIHHRAGDPRPRRCRPFHLLYTLPRQGRTACQRFRKRQEFAAVGASDWQRIRGQNVRADHWIQLGHV